MKNINDLISEIKHNLGDAPDQFFLDNKFYRFNVGKSKKSGWVVGKEWNHNGKDYFAVTYAAWNRGNDRFKFVSWNKSDEIQNPSILTELRLLEERAQKEIEKIEEKNLIKILENFSQFEKLDSPKNKYLELKKFVTTENLYKDKFNNLVVPIYCDFEKSVVGYQKVYTTHKAFPTGQKVGSNFFFFGDVKKAEFIYLCEGIATAATIFEVTGIPTVSCFQANNLPSVIKKIKTQLQGKNVVIACDNDTNSQTGITFAKKAKAKFGNAAIILPDFGTPDTALTDFNDLFVSKGFDETKKQLQFDNSDFVNVDFLGRSRNGIYYFYSNRDKTLKSFTYEKIKAQNLTEIAKDSWWAQRFIPLFDKDGLVTNKTNWKLSSEMVVERQQAVGFYSPNNLRGVGSWTDQGRHILNLGDEVLCDGEKSEFGKSHSLKKFYIPSDKKIEIKLDFSKDFGELRKAIDLTDFESERDRILFLGYIAFAQIFSTQRWRPHIWLRADKGTGKSSLLSLLNSLIQNSILFQDPTAAGIRQYLGADALVCLVDEAEGNQKRMREVMELQRQCSSDDSSVFVRGSSSGEANTYSTQTSFAFASIKLTERTPADESRIIDIFLKKSETKNTDRNQKRVSAFHNAKKLRVDLFSYMNSLLPEFEHIKKEIHKEILASTSLDARFADQFAPILSGYICLFPDDNYAEIIAQTLKSDVEEVENKTTDKKEFVENLMQLVFRVGTQNMNIQMMFDDFLRHYQKNHEPLEYIKKELETLGIHYLHRLSAFGFEKNNALKKIMARDTDYPNYWSTLIKNSAFESKVTLICGKTKRIYVFKP